MNSRAISSFAAILVSLAIIFMYVSPTWSGQIASAKAAIAADDKTLAAAKQFIAHEEELTTARDQMDAKSLARVNALLPDSVNAIATLVNINALALTNNMTVSTVDTEKPLSSSGTDDAAVSGKTAMPYTVTIHAVGSYEAFKKFLIALEHSQTLYDVVSIDIENAVANTGVYSYVIKAHAYWLP